MSGADHPYRSCIKVLVTWLPLFLLEPHSLEKSSCSRDPKASKPKEDLGDMVRLLCFVSPIRSSKGLSRPVSNPLSIHSSLLRRLEFGVVDQPLIKQFFSPKTLRTVLKPKKKGQYRVC